MKVAAWKGAAPAPARVVMALAPEDWMVMVPLDWLTMVYCAPCGTPVVGSRIVWVVDPVHSMVPAAVPTVRVVVPAAVAVLVKVGAKALALRNRLASHSAIEEAVGVEVAPTTDACGSPVQFVSVPDVGVPSTGVVKFGDVMVCTPVNVLAASVRAIVALVDGNVMVVASVPAKVRSLLKIGALPAATTVPVQPAAVVGVATCAVKTPVVLAANVTIVFAPDDCTVTAPLDWLTMVHC